MFEMVKLKDVSDYGDDRVAINSVVLGNYVTTDNLLQNKLGLTKALNMPPQGGSIPSFEKSDVLVANIRPYLKKIWFADRSGGCSADVLVIRTKKHYEPKFVYYALHRDDFFNHMMRGAKGTKMPRGDKDQIMDFILPKVSKSYQQKIAAVLSALDAKIELNNRINAELETMAKTLYDYWFVQFDFPDKNGKPYQSSGGKMVYNETLKREVPDGWGAGYIGNILEKVPATKKISSKEILAEGMYPVIDQSMDYICGFTNEKEALIKSVRPHIIFGDHTRIVKLINFDFARGADGTQVLLSSDPRMPQHLFYLSLLKIDLSNYGYARHFKFLKETSMILPEKNLSERFEIIAQSAFNKIKHSTLENQQLTQLRDWLLPMLMNGQVTMK